MEVPLIETIKKMLFGGEKRPDRTLSRNELCWCGSGEKYKNCHMERDQDEDRRKRASCRGFS